MSSTITPDQQNILLKHAGSLCTSEVRIALAPKYGIQFVSMLMGIMNPLDRDLKLIESIRTQDDFTFLYDTFTKVHGMKCYAHELEPFLISPVEDLKQKAVVNDIIITQEQKEILNQLAGNGLGSSTIYPALTMVVGSDVISRIISTRSPAERDMILVQNIKSKEQFNQLYNIINNEFSMQHIASVLRPYTSVPSVPVFTNARTTRMIPESINMPTIPTNVVSTSSSNNTPNEPPPSYDDVMNEGKPRPPVVVNDTLLIAISSIDIDPLYKEQSSLPLEKDYVRSQLVEFSKIFLPEWETLFPYIALAVNLPDSTIKNITYTTNIQQQITSFYTEIIRMSRWSMLTFLEILRLFHFNPPHFK